MSNVQRTNKKPHSKHKTKAQRRKRTAGNPEQPKKNRNKNPRRQPGPQMTRKEWRDTDKFDKNAADGRKRMTLANGSVSVGVKYSPSEVTVTDIGRLWEESEKNNKVKMFDRGKKLPKMSFTIELLDLDNKGHASELQTIDKKIKDLKSMANSTRPVRVLYTMFESGLWYITGLQLVSVRREPKSNMVVWAKVSVDMVSAEEEERNKLPTEKAAAATTPTTTPRTPSRKKVPGVSAKPIDFPANTPDKRRPKTTINKNRPKVVDDGASVDRTVGGSIGAGKSKGVNDGAKVGLGIGGAVGGRTNKKTNNRPTKKQQPAPAPNPKSKKPRQKDKFKGPDLGSWF